LLQVLNEHKPHIVHFSGHGGDDGSIVLVDDHGSPRPVPTRAMRALFSALRDNIRLVVLNACYSTSQARVIADIVGCAVGMRSTVADAAATVFAASFYRAIGFGRSVAEAFMQGTAALLLEGVDRQAKPRLLAAKNLEPAELILVNGAMQVAGTALDERDVERRSDGIDELIAILRHRADHTIGSLSRYYKYVEIKEHLERFRVLHERHIDALQKRNMTLAHEILIAIHKLSFVLERSEFWARHRAETPDTCYSLADNAFREGRILRLYHSGDVGGRTPDLPDENGRARDIHRQRDRGQMTPAMYLRLFIDSSDFPA